MLLRQMTTRPDQEFSWRERIRALRGFDDPNPADVEATADGALRAGENATGVHFPEELKLLLHAVLRLSVFLFPEMLPDPGKAL